MTPTLPSFEALRLVMPEIVLTIGMCLVILVPLVRRESRALVVGSSLLTLFAALLATVATLPHAGAIVFSGMLTIDPFAQFFKILLLLFAILIVAQWSLLSRDKTHVHDVPDYHCLLLGAVLGMSLLGSATNLLMIFLAMEAASYPSYALAGFRKGLRKSTEASLKYVVFGASSSAVMVYGMSLIYACTGSFDLAALAQASVTVMSPMLAIGLLAMFVGVAFKLSAVPLHFWCPDVFEGSPIEVTTFLSVASKGAAVCLLVRITQTVGEATFALGADPLVGLATGLALLGAVTATWGNLVAYHQTNIKRLLAYSSIAHAGYMIMAAALLVIAQPGPASRAIIGAILFYLVVYLFMNLGAFTVATVLSAQLTRASKVSDNDESYGENINHYAGLIQRAPLPTILMAVFLLSLFGMPGLGGFMGKIYLAVGMLEAGAWAGYILIAVLLINTLLSLYFYLKPVYLMVFKQLPEVDAPKLTTDIAALRPIYVSGLAGLVLAVCLIGVLWTGILPGMMGELTHEHATILTSRSTAVQLSVNP